MSDDSEQQQEITPEPAKKKSNAGRWILVGAVCLVFLGVVGFAFDRYMRIPRLSADRPEETQAQWRMLLSSSTFGGVDVHSYRVRLKRSPMPGRLREAQVPETSPFELNRVPLELKEWVDYSLDEPIHVSNRDPQYLPLDLRHTLFEGAAIIDLEISFGVKDEPKTLKLPGLKIKARRHF